MIRRVATGGAVLIALLAGMARGTAAQQPSALSIDATLGRVYGYSAAEYLSDREGITADLMLRLRSGAAGARGVVFGANVSLQDGGPRTTECRRATTHAGCVQPFPFVHLGGALVGWENSRSTLRLMGGPAWAHGERDALAWQARVDGSLPLHRRVGLLGSVRGTVVPNYGGNAVSLLGLGLGIRVR